MELYVNPTITGFRQDVDGTIKELKIGSNKEDAWANIAEQGASAKLDNNKAATIDVSTYTEPVVINPTSGKDGMKKATITLSNIPSPSGVTTLYCWAGTVSEGAVYTTTATPSENDKVFGIFVEYSTYLEVKAVDTYADGKITVKDNPIGSEEYARHSIGDISLT